MTDLALRDLRNNVSEVLRRVEAGEQLTVTVNGRPVARIMPLPSRPRAMPWRQVLAQPADPGLGDDLRSLLPDTTDDIDDPWEKAGGE
jgi:prevent-host-death family protein